MNADQMLNLIPRGRLPIAGSLLALLLSAGAAPGGTPPAPGPETPKPPVVLAIVNGEAITSADLDRELISSHQQMSGEDRKSYDYRRLLEKLVNDRLLEQDAIATGLDTEAGVSVLLEEKRQELVVKHFVAQTFVAPDSVPSSEIRDFFQRHYFQIQLRQISVRTEEEALALKRRLESGASMDSLARAVSLDTHRNQGGLRNLIYWADLENVLREQAQVLAVGSLSEPFPYREAYSVIRVEQRTGVDEGAFAQFAPSIRASLRAKARQSAWERFLAELEERYPVQRDSQALAAITADSAVVFTGVFLKESERAALTIDAQHVVDEGELRRAISHGAMSMGTAPFDSILASGIQRRGRELVLACAAERAGLAEDPGLREQFVEEERQILVQAYLAEFIVPQIKFRHDEFQAFYEANQDRFRGPDEVRLGTMLVGDEETAKEVAGRLQAGADWKYLMTRHGGSDSHDGGAWIAVNALAPEVQDALAEVVEGETTAALKIPSGWVIFKALGRRAGPVPPIEEVEIQIREVMFQKKFTELLDQHLEKLESQSEVLRDVEAIEAYFRGAS